LQLLIIAEASNQATETARSNDYEDDDELWKLDVNGCEEGHEATMTMMIVILTQQMQQNCLLPVTLKLTEPHIFC